MRLRGALTVVFLLAALAIAAPAQASSCKYLASIETVVVSLPGSSDVVSLTRNGTHISDGATNCGAATVDNTDTIFIRDTTANRNGDDLVGIDLSGGAFAPGVKDEGPIGVSEIEILLYLERGDNFVRVTGGTGADNIHFGRTVDQDFNGTIGINLNGAAESDPNKIADPDVTFEEASPPNPAANEKLQVDGDAGPDILDASGGPGFDTPLMTQITMFGGLGNDRLTGGGGWDTLFADQGEDVLDGGNGVNTATYQSAPNGVNIDLGNPQPQSTGAFGKDKLTHIGIVEGSSHDDVLTGTDTSNGLIGLGGNDLLLGKGSSDGLDGGPGNDTASYLTPPAGETKGVTVDLGKAVAQNTTGAGFDTLTSVENLWGSPFADELTGDAAPNVLVGFQGKDSLNGKEGEDQFAIRDGVADQVTCGPGGDHVVSDTQGTDSIFSDCETVDLAPFVKPPPGDPGKPPPGGNTPPPPPPADTLVPVLKNLRLRPASFALVARKRKGVLRRAGTQISYRLSEAASVSFGVQRAVGRRRWKGVKGSFVHAGLPAALNSLHFNGRVRGKRLARGRYRLVARAVDGAKNRSVRRFARFSVVR
jgi:Ca2+-binding RTX toxin-like protein